MSVLSNQTVKQGGGESLANELFIAKQKVNKDSSLNASLESLEKDPDVR